WSAVVCSSDLRRGPVTDGHSRPAAHAAAKAQRPRALHPGDAAAVRAAVLLAVDGAAARTAAVQRERRVTNRATGRRRWFRHGRQRQLTTILARLNRRGSGRAKPPPLSRPEGHPGRARSRASPIASGG